MQSVPPNIIELFSAQGLGLFVSHGRSVRRRGRREPEASDAACFATGVPAGVVGSPSLDSPGAQYYFKQGGNTDLTPEDADTYSYGIVLQPRWVPGLSVTVDYFDIKWRT